MYSDGDRDPLTHCYRVGELTAKIATTLEQALPAVLLSGEISNFRPAGAGHWYFALKDEQSMIQAVMFRFRTQNVRFVPRDGMVVRVTGAVQVYQKRGVYQIVCETMQHAGEGELLLMLEQRKRRLAAEGLFALDRKRPIPMMPRSVAVVTSPTGAAIRDVLTVLRRRNAAIRVVVLPTLVQGEAAAITVAEQIRRAGRYGLGEVIIVTRGGGSVEDLLPFSDEAVVRAVAESPVPVITAIGHETDTCLADFAADVRAPTPSAAAEMVAAHRDELVRRLVAAAGTVSRSLFYRLERSQATVRAFRTAELERTFRSIAQPIYQRLDDAKETVLSTVADRLRRLRSTLELSRQAIDAYSPLGVLERGYVAVYDADEQRLLPRLAAARRVSRVHLRFFDGSVAARLDNCGGTDESDTENGGRDGQGTIMKVADE